jgi:hypothetical protein
VHLKCGYVSYTRTSCVSGIASYINWNSLNHQLASIVRGAPSSHAATNLCCTQLNLLGILDPCDPSICYEICCVPPWVKCSPRSLLQQLQQAADLGCASQQAGQLYQVMRDHIKHLDAAQMSTLVAVTGGEGRACIIVSC